MSLLLFVVVQVRFGIFNLRSVAWRLAGSPSQRRAIFLQLVSRAMVWIGSRYCANHLEIEGLCIYETSCNVSRRERRVWIQSWKHIKRFVGDVPARDTELNASDMFFWQLT
jgi:hypothetical protein